MDEFILTFTRNDTDSNSLRFIRYLYSKMKLGPGFSEKPHPNAIYTSRALSSLISKSSTIDFSSINSVSAKQVPNLQHQNVSGPLNYLTANSSRKRNNEELNIETQNSKKIRKNINTDDSDKELY
ncbi:23235_t:CDS:2 [Rhizophagus irregularis]|nr:23235_t:CDS:2 [Rhizophagus irregularis]